MGRYFHTISTLPDALFKNQLQHNSYFRPKHSLLVLYVSNPQYACMYGNKIAFCSYSKKSKKLLTVEDKVIDIPRSVDKTDIMNL